MEKEKEQTLETKEKDLSIDNDLQEQANLDFLNDKIKEEKYKIAYERARLEYERLRVERENLIKNNQSMLHLETVEKAPEKKEKDIDLSIFIKRDK